MQQPGDEGSPPDSETGNRSSQESMRITVNPQNSVLSALPLPVRQRKMGDQPPVCKNVESVITKAKKAASYLYTLLHAKNCRLGADQCRHPGCADAKLMYLHLKTCRAEGVSCCSSNYKGCVEARKLLLHYRRCRETRARKASGQGESEPQFCLVCSLVARKAKHKPPNNYGGRSHSPNGSRTRKQLIPSMNFRCTPVTQPQKQQSRIRPRSFPFSEVGGQNSAKPVVPIQLVKPMPPPPPRMSNTTTARQPQSTISAQALQSTISSALTVSRTTKHATRPRAESLDWHKARSPEDSEELSSQQPVMCKDGFHVPMPRRRSASFHDLCTNPSSFETIEEEPVGEELQEILEGDR